ncbi:MAG: RHS repeat-associated core domain-containing protein, partial [Candidatus Electrothrix sp. ATG2]|nr:RHS repeat-associated core domain-containing protein [Candidatus Electrothrix sp. ATG2]
NGNSHHNYRYDPYGAVLPEKGNFTDPHNHYTLTGKEFDENTGLVWFGARFYEPETGVWINQDTYRGEIVLPESLHRYMYVYDNPVSYFDPNGLSIDFKALAIKTVGGRVGDALGVINDLAEGNYIKAAYEYDKVVIKESLKTIPNISKEVIGKTNLLFDLIDININMNQDYKEQGVDLSEAYSLNNIKESTTMFFQQPKDMFGYTLEEVTSNGIPVLTAATIKTFTFGIVDIKGEDVKSFIPHYTYQPDYVKDINSVTDQNDLNHSCMAYPAKKSGQTDYWQGYFQGQSVDPAYMFTGY